MKIRWLAEWLNPLLLQDDDNNGQVSYVCFLVSNTQMNEHELDRYNSFDKMNKMLDVLLRNPIYLHP